MNDRAQTLDQIMATRRSVRSFRDQRLEENVIRELLAAAISAPSASNKQPWRFVVVDSRATIAAMAEAVRAAIDQIARHVMPESEASFRAYGDYFTRFECAPTVIVPICRGPSVLSRLVDDGLAADARARIAAMERDSALTSTALALQNLLLAAHARGLGASAMTGPLVAADRLQRLLELPESWSIVALVPIGHPAEEPAATERKSIDTVTRWIR